MTFDPSVRALLAVLLVIAGLAGCGPESREIVVKPEVNFRTIGLTLQPGDAPYELDVDSNGVIDYTLSVYAESTASRDKAIFRVQGVITDLLTTVVHGSLRELSDEQQCDVTYPSVLEAGILATGGTVGSNLDTDWWMIGDFHHQDLCFGVNCSCPGMDPDIRYIPMEEGSTGYIGLRFIRNRQRHFAWLELRRTVSPVPGYVIERVAWRRSPEKSLPIDN